MFKFQKSYFLLAILLFITEVCIALFVNDKIVRPYVGDFLVVILLYCAIKSFLKIPVIKAALLVLLFAYSIEILQYLNILRRLGLEKSLVARTVIGSSFEWIDMLAYTMGIVLVLLIEIKNARPQSPATDRHSI
jgi:hypothetical protein